MRGNWVQIVVTVSEGDAKPILEAMGKAGAGKLGEYTFCSFTTAGMGRFLPGADAQPHVGEVGQVSTEPELRIETFCKRNVARDVVQAIRWAHPYEEPIIYIVPLLDEDTL